MHTHAVVYIDTTVKDFDIYYETIVCGTKTRKKLNCLENEGFSKNITRWIKTRDDQKNERIVSYHHPQDT